METLEQTYHARPREPPAYGIPLEGRRKGPLTKAIRGTDHRCLRETPAERTLMVAIFGRDQGQEILSWEWAPWYQWK